MDLALNNGLFFDGTGAKPALKHLGIKDGKVVELSDTPLVATRMLDCKGGWVMPGFVDLHTHYDAEIEAAPALGESLRHGVAAILIDTAP